MSEGCSGSRAAQGALAVGVAVALLTGCSSDPCDGVVCGQGRVCIDGRCRNRDGGAVDRGPGEGAPDGAIDARREEEGDAIEVDGGADSGPDFEPASHCVGPWCWEHPLPQGNRLNAIWGAGPTAVYAVGNGGTVIRGDGVAWQVIASGPQRYRDVGGSGPADVYAVGNSGVVRHFDGSGWSDVSTGLTGTTLAVYAADPDNVFIAGSSGLARFDGTGWVLSPAVNAGALWGSGPTDVWAVRFESWHFDGTGWVEVPLSTSQPLLAVHGLGPTEVYAAGNGETIVRYDGSAWHTVQELGGPTAIADIWVASASDLFYVTKDAIKRHNGTAALDVTPLAAFKEVELTGIWGSSATDVYVCGANGTVQRLEAAGWRGLLGGEGRQLYDVWSDGTRAFAVGKNTALRDEGSGWHETLGSAVTLVSVWGTSATSVLALGGGSLHRFDGSAWSVVAAASTSLNAIWGVGDTAFAVGHQVVARVDGDVVAEESSPTNETLFAVWGAGPTDVFACGLDSTIAHYDGSGWSAAAIDSASTFLRGIHGSGHDNVLAVGELGRIYRYDGTNWTVTTSGLSQTLYDVWVGGPQQALALGPGGGVKLAGSAWQPIQAGIDLTLTDVSGVTGDVVAIGAEGQIVRYRP